MQKDAGTSRSAGQDDQDQVNYAKVANDDETGHLAGGSEGQLEGQSEGHPGRYTCTQPLTYRLEDPCPVHVGGLYGVQMLMENSASLLGVAYLVHGAVCGGTDKVLLAQLVSSYIFLVGLGTMLQTSIGIRMPIMEGSSYAYLGPVMAMMATQQWSPCQPACDHHDNTALNVTMVTMATEADLERCVDKPWRKPLLEISGGLMCAAAVQTVLGVTGAVGFLLSYISSLTVATTVALLGLSVAPFIADSAGKHWGIALLTFGLYFLSALVLGPVKVPLPSWSRRHGFSLSNTCNIFRLFPSLFALSISWLLCYILTETGVFTDDPTRPAHQSRTDIKMDVVYAADWLFIPYPGRYGMPTIGAGIFLGFLGSVIVSTIESIGDYYAFSRACQLPPVVASRSAWQVVSLVFMVGGVFGKLGAALSVVPDPVIAGFNIIGVGLITAVGLSCLQFVDLRSVRNLLVLGSSLMFGLMVPYFLKTNPGAIDTGSREFDQILNIVLTTSMTVGGVTCFVLDNLVPGTKEERGLLSETTLQKDQEQDELRRAYDIPLVSQWLHKVACCRYLPFLPVYDDSAVWRRCGHPCRAKHSPDGADAATVNV